MADKNTQRVTTQYDLGWAYYPIIRNAAAGLQKAGADLQVTEGPGRLSKVFYLSGQPVDVLRCIFRTKMGIASARALTADMR